MNHTPLVKIGSQTDMGVIKAIQPTGVQLEYRGQIFVASFATIEKMVSEGKVK